jgi:solute carrier family 50 protein (sugar transporter)
MFLNLINLFMLQIPSALGVVFALGQVILYAIYYKSTQQILQARKQQILETRKSKADQIPMTEVVVDGKNGSTAGSGAGKGHC